MRENHYAILVCNLKISYVSKYRISITLLYVFVCLWKELHLSDCKITKKVTISPCYLVINCNKKDVFFQYLFVY